MLRLCNNCGKTCESESDDLCVYCGVPMSSSMEAIDSEFSKTGGIPVGTHIQLIIRIVYIISLMNLVVGPALAFVAMFSVMFPYQFFTIVPTTVFLFCALLSPLIAVSCLVLIKVAKQRFDKEKHAPLNHWFRLASYTHSIRAIIAWLTVVLAGIMVNMC